MPKVKNMTKINESERPKIERDRPKFVILNLEPLTRLAGMPEDFFGFTNRIFYYYTGIAYLGAIEMPFGGRADAHSLIPFTDEEIRTIQDIADNKIESKSLEDMLSKIYDIVVARAKKIEEEDPNMQGFSTRLALIYLTDGYDEIIYIAGLPR
jgi:hypothetical protein